MDSFTVRGLRWALSLGVGLGLIAAGALTALAPDGPAERTLVTVMVRLDTPFTEVAQMLKDAGAIPSAEQFVERAKTRGAIDQVKVGAHTIVLGETPDQILDKLTKVKAP